MKIIQGNLLDLAENGMFDLIIHGCNCFNTFGSGLAKEIKERYPQAYAADCETTRGDRNKLGSYTLSYFDGANPFIIVNSYTQFGFNSYGNHQDLFEYDAFQKILDELLHNYGTCRLALPMIGCGLAGGQPAKIVAMIDEFSDKVEALGGTVTLVEFI